MITEYARIWTASCDLISAELHGSTKIAENGRKHTWFRCDVMLRKGLGYTLDLLRFPRKPESLQHLTHGFGNVFLSTPGITSGMPHEVFGKLTFLKSNRLIYSVKTSALPGLEIKSPNSRLSSLRQFFKKMARLRGRGTP
jgi:hypothetical protein